MKRPVAKFECLACGHTDYQMSDRVIGDLALGECPKCGGDMAVVARELPPRLSEIEALVSKHFEIADFSITGDRAEFDVLTTDTKTSFTKTLQDLKSRGYLAALRERKGELKLLVARHPKPKKENVLINVLMLMATIATTFGAGYYFGGNLNYAFLFSGSIMLILGAHELGHKIAAWRHGVETTPPYFIPMPPPFPGTLGAIIKIKSPIPTKEALVEMGATGPIFGFLVALPLVVVGLMMSTTLVSAPFSLSFSPLLLGLLKLSIPGVSGFHPFVLAGWLGMLVTMLNLTPAGQLDGGHVARGLLGPEQHYKLTRMLGFTFIMLGLFIPFMLVWGLLILFLFRGLHMGALDDVSKISQRQKFLAIAVWVIFLLCIPIPIG